MHPKQRARGDEDDPTMYVQDAYAALDSLLALLNETRMLDASSPQDVEALAAIVREGITASPHS